jgi:hypothetical protein
MVIRYKTSQPMTRVRIPALQGYIGQAKGQYTMEWAVLLSVVGGAIALTSALLTNCVQGYARQAAEDIGDPVFAKPSSALSLAIDSVECYNDEDDCGLKPPVSADGGGLQRGKDDKFLRHIISKSNRDVNS